MRALRLPATAQSLAIESYRLGEDGTARPQTDWLQIFRLGPVYDYDGVLVDTFTDALLLEVAATFAALEPDPTQRPKLDWNHGSVDPFASMFPDIGRTYGELVAVAVDDTGLWGRFTLTAAGVDLIKRQEGDLYLSPTLTNEAIFHPSTGERLGRGVCAVALTPTPRQDWLQAVSLARESVEVVAVTYNRPASSRGGSEMPETEAPSEGQAGGDAIAALEAKLAECMAELAECKAQLAALAEEGTEDMTTDESEQTVSLRRELAEVKAEVKAARQENYKAKRDAEIEKLLVGGRITPAEQPDAVLAYDAFHLEGSSYNAWERHYASRKAGQAWPVGALGKGVSPDSDPTEESVRKLCRQTATDNGTTFWAELGKWRKENPEANLRLFGREH